MRFHEGSVTIFYSLVHLFRDIATLNLCFQAFKDLWDLEGMRNIVPATKQADEQRKQARRVDKKLTSLLKKL